MKFSQLLSLNSSDIGRVKQLSPSTIPSFISSIENKEVNINPSINKAQSTETVDQAENRKSILDPHITDVKHPYRTLSHLPQSSYLGNYVFSSLVIFE